MEGKGGNGTVDMTLRVKESVGTMVEIATNSGPSPLKSESWSLFPDFNWCAAFRKDLNVNYSEKIKRFVFEGGL